MKKVPVEITSQYCDEFGNLTYEETETIYEYIPTTRKEKIKAQIEDKINNLIGKINLLLFKIFIILFSPILSILFCIDEKRNHQSGDKPLKLIK